MSLPKWTSKSVAHLKRALQQMRHTIADTAIRDLLLCLGYSLRANKKNFEGTSHPDRDAQFEHINQTLQQFERQGKPIISVDCKKKEGWACSFLQAFTLIMELQHCPDYFWTIARDCVKRSSLRPGVPVLLSHFERT